MKTKEQILKENNEWAEKAVNATYVQEEMSWLVMEVTIAVVGFISFAALLFA